MAGRGNPALTKVGMMNKHKIVYTIKLKFDNVADINLQEQAINLDIKNNQNLFGAKEIWLDDIEEWGLHERKI